jgi:hypothetical protein
MGILVVYRVQMQVATLLIKFRAYKIEDIYGGRQSLAMYSNLTQMAKQQYQDSRERYSRSQPLNAGPFQSRD